MRGVAVEVEGSPPAAMTNAGGDRYEAGVQLDECEQVARYRFAVTTPAVIGGGDSTERFPSTGSYSAALVGQPPHCAGFPATARTFDVDDVDDFPDAVPGDGVCAGPAGDGGACSLRAAVMEANALPGTDLIRLPIARYRLTRTGLETDAVADASVNDLDLTESVTIEGVGVADDVGLLDFLACESVSPIDGGCFFSRPAADLIDDPERDRAIPKIDAGGIDRAFEVHVSVDRERPAGLRDLAILNGDSGSRPGGGVRNDGTLVLDRVAIVGNAVSEGNRVPGGGLANYGTLNATDVAFAHNEVNGRNPAGGGLYNHAGARARIVRALFAFNRARFSSALRNAGATDALEAGEVTVENATFFNNPKSASTPSTVLNVVGDAGSMSLAAVTVAGQGAAGSSATARLIEGNADTRLRGSLLVDNRTPVYCAGGITSAGGNVTDEPCGFGRSGARDRLDVSVGLAADGLQDRGGFTPVVPLRAPREGRPNPAIDAAAFGPWPLDDQRGTGFDRRVDGDGDGSAVPDAGAFELGASPDA